MITVDDLLAMRPLYSRTTTEGYLYRMAECPRVQFVVCGDSLNSWLWFVDGHQMGLGQTGLTAAMFELKTPPLLTVAEVALLATIKGQWLPIIDGPGPETDKPLGKVWETVFGLIDKGFIDLRSITTDLDRSRNRSYWVWQVRRRAS